MLSNMRSLSQHWFGRAIMAVVLGFIILSFAVWGIGDRFTGFNANELAKVGSTRITVEQFQDTYRSELRRLEQAQKRGIRNDEAQRLGLPRRVLSQVLTEAVLDQQAARLGLAVGDGEIVRSIMKDPAFKGPAGRFDQGTFQRLLQENGYSEASYARTQRSLILRRDVSEAVIGGIELPNALAVGVHRYGTETRDFDFFVLPPGAAGTVPAPSEAEVKTYYDEHAAAFVAPEYRKLLIVSVVPANIVKPDAVSDADAAARYEAEKATRFATPEKRTVEQLLLPDRAAAEAAEGRVKNGEAFAKLAADAGKTAADISLGTVTKADLADPALADAAFALPESGTSAPVQTRFGIVLVHVAKIEPGRQRTLDEARVEIKDGIAHERAQQQAVKMRDAIEDARTAGKTLTEVAASVGLTPRTIDAVDAQGRDRAGKPVEGLPAGPQLLKTAFATDRGADTEMIATGNGGDVWYEVADIDPAHRLALGEVKARVEAGWRADEVARRLAAAADRIVGEVDGGKALTALAVENGKLPVLRASNIGRGGGPELPQLVAASFFATEVGKAGSVSYGAQGRLVFRIEAAHVPPFVPGDDRFGKFLAEVKTGFEDDVLSQYLVRVQGEIGTSVNQRALDTALGDSGS